MARAGTSFVFVSGRPCRSGPIQVKASLRLGDECIRKAPPPDMPQMAIQEIDRLANDYDRAILSGASDASKTLLHSTFNDFWQLLSPLAVRRVMPGSVKVGGRPLREILSHQDLLVRFHDESARGPDTQFVKHMRENIGEINEWKRDGRQPPAPQAQPVFRLAAG